MKAYFAKKALLNSWSTPIGRRGMVEIVPPDLRPSRDLLPPPLSLLSEMAIPSDLSAKAIYNLSCLRLPDPFNSSHFNPSSFIPLYDETTAPPSIPIPPPVTDEEELHPDVPMYLVGSTYDVKEMEEFCGRHPICILRAKEGEGSLFNINLDLFSTVNLLSIAPDHPVEVRQQPRQDPDYYNVDKKSGMPTWRFKSAKFDKDLTLTEHAAYQEKCHQREQAVKDEEKKSKQAEDDGIPRKKRKIYEPKTLRFGTNVDLSTEEMFKRHRKELKKMPSFCGVNRPNDMLRHVGYQVLGMNTVQVYLKVGGARTPAHIENNCIGSVNINVGPGECEWFGVDYKYWSVIDNELKEQDIDFLSDSWWPNYVDLTKKLGVPTYRFNQKVGDVVVVGPGCVHWVQS
ncbi:hypothetical protein PFISCL1PPCAC_1612, partial [Pristionchus fissidentatus]